MNRLRDLKIGVTAFFTVCTGLLGSLAVPVYVLVMLNLVDYATGLMAAPFRQERVSSYKGIRGIAKKVCMWLLIAVGAVLDWLLAYTGLQNPLSHPAACTVAVWLLVNELISILENIGDIGVPVPAFLEKLLAMIQEKNS